MSQILYRSEYNNIVSTVHKWPCQKASLFHLVSTLPKRAHSDESKASRCCYVAYWSDHLLLLSCVPNISRNLQHRFIHLCGVLSCRSVSFCRVANLLNVRLLRTGIRDQRRTLALFNLVEYLCHAFWYRSCLGSLTSLRRVFSTNVTAPRIMSPAMSADRG